MDPRKQVKGLPMARWRDRIRLEDGLKLDLNRLLSEGYGKAGENCLRAIHWSDVGSGKLVAVGTIEMEMQFEHDARAMLRLGRLAQFIRPVREPRLFAGGQWYFVCPSTARIVSTLWLPAGALKFSSRQTWGQRAAYGSQFHTPHDRAMTSA
jgi:hypothetical protein